MVEVVIDPGHEGIMKGQDPGAVSIYGVEATWTYKISKYMQQQLKWNGIDSILTRGDNDEISNSERAKLASQGVYCFSNHLNAGGGKRGEVIHSIHNDGKLANEIADEWQRVGQPTVKVYSRKGRNGDYYFMHRDTGKATTLILEYCFIDNKADFEQFEVKWKKYVDGVVKAYCAHTGRKYLSPASPTQYITVKPGDTVSRIAHDYKTTVSKIKSLNNLNNVNVIVVGQKLRVH